MGAYAKYHNDQGFILDEERIRKIHEILTNRGQTISPDCKPKYKLKRSDSFIYETDDIQAILNEHNSPSQKIEQISIEMSYGQLFLLSLIFSIQTSLNIEGENRDFVYLIYSDLKQYLHNEVNVGSPANIQKVLNSKPLWYGLLIIMIGWLGISMHQYELKRSEYRRQYEQEVAQWKIKENKENNRRISQRNNEVSKINDTAKQAIESKNLDKKLDFLIKQSIPRKVNSSESYSSDYPDYKFPERPINPNIFFIVMMVITSSVFLDAILPKFYAKNLFLIGKEIHRHSKASELRDKIIWGIFVSFIIGILSSVAVMLLTNTSNSPPIKPSNHKLSNQSFLK